MTQLTRHICALSRLPDTLVDRIELIPVGEFRLDDKRGKLPMQLTEAPAVIAASFAAAPGGVLPIDFDHRSFADQGHADSRAAGWITAMEVEGDRIWASVDWTPDGRKALEDRSYRFVSPVFKALKDGRVVRIEGAGLVNTPALPQLRQLASKEEDADHMDLIHQIAEIIGIAADKPADIVARVRALAAAQTQLASIARAAGVADADGDATTQICARLQAKAPDPALFVPMASFSALQTQMASLQKEVTDGKVEEALEAARAEGKLTPDLDEWATQLASKDLAEFQAWAKVAPVRINLSGRHLAGRVPPAKVSQALDDTERHVASMMGVADTVFVATRNANVKED